MGGAAARTIVAGAVLALAGLPALRLMAETTRPEWKGAESLTLVALAPNVTRCGQPPVLEARLVGDGLDALGGLFTVTASGCIDPDRLQITDIEATDTFRGGDSLLIAPADVTLSVDSTSCVATNTTPVAFQVVGGTGRYAGATGEGTYHMMLNWPACNGVTVPARVWFEGTLRTARS